MLAHDEETLVQLAEENLDRLYGDRFSFSVKCLPQDEHAPYHLKAVGRGNGEDIIVTDDSLTEAVSRMEKKCQAAKEQIRADHYHY
ncbi:MAG: hypothetical protein ACYC8S_02030 [Minisyncoccota bacterium]